MVNKIKFKYLHTLLFKSKYIENKKRRRQSIGEKFVKQRKIKEDGKILDDEATNVTKVTKQWASANKL